MLRKYINYCEPERVLQSSLAHSRYPKSRRSVRYLYTFSVKPNPKPESTRNGDFRVRVRVCLPPRPTPGWAALLLLPFAAIEGAGGGGDRQMGGSLKHFSFGWGHPPCLCCMPLASCLMPLDNGKPQVLLFFFFIRLSFGFNCAAVAAVLGSWFLFYFRSLKVNLERSRK